MSGSLMLTILMVGYFTGTVISNQAGKVDNDLYQDLQDGKSSTVIIHYQPDSTKTNYSPTIDCSRKTNPFSKQFEQQLVPIPTEGLAQIIGILNSYSVTYVVIWNANQIVIYDAWLKLVLWLVEVTIVVRILPDVLILPDLPAVLTSAKPGSTSNSPLDFNDRCPDITRLGDDVIVGIISTGALWNHPELKDNWIKNPYGWFNGTNPGSSNQLPTDTKGDGTAALSLMVGKTLGKAPKASWLACSGCSDTGRCSQAAYLVCLQYMYCPWDNTKPQPAVPPANCEYRPKVVLIQNLRINYAQLLNPGDYWMYNIIQQWNDEGIISITSIGDGGPICNSGSIPGAYDIMIAVGAVDDEGTVIDTSSRGPSLLNGTWVKNSVSYGYCPKVISDNSECTAESNKDKPPCIFTKPDILAYGWNCKVVWNNLTDPDPYTVQTGTFQAAAQVAGAAALVVSNSNNVDAWNQQKLYKVITESAHRNATKLLQSDSTVQEYSDTSHLFCDVLMGKNCTGFPSNVYAWGVLNICNAVKAGKELK